MTAASKFSRLAVGDRRTRPAIQTYSAPKYLVQDDRMSEELPFGSRGGFVIHLEKEHRQRLQLLGGEGAQVVCPAQHEQGGEEKEAGERLDRAPDEAKDRR